MSRFHVLKEAGKCVHLKNQHSVTPYLTQSPDRFLSNIIKLFMCDNQQNFNDDLDITVVSVVKVCIEAGKYI